MTNPIDINPKSFRQYFFEYAVLFLIASTTYLFVVTQNLNHYIRTEQIKVIEENTKAITNFINFQKIYK